MSVEISAANPERQRLQQWSRDGRVALQRPAMTDDWARLRNTANGQKLAHIGTFKIPQPQQSGGATPRVPGAKYGDGRVDPVGDPIMQRVSARDLHGAGPLNYSLPPIRKSARRDLLRTSFNERARTGHVYWYRERPKPTSFGKYGIGSYKTVLGLGSAPRT